MSDVKAAKQPSGTQTKLKEFDALRTLLKNAKNPAGQDLHNHLVEIINHLVIHCPHKAIDSFEEVSYLLKNKDKIDMKEFLNIEEDHPYSRHSDDIAELTKDFIAKARKFFEVSFGLVQIVRKPRQQVAVKEKRLKVVVETAQRPSDTFQTSVPTQASSNGPVSALANPKRY